MKVKAEWDRVWQELDTVCYEVLLQYLSEGTEQIHIRGQSPFRLRSEPRTSGIWNTSGNYLNTNATNMMTPARTLYVLFISY